MFTTTERDPLVALLRGSLSIWGVAGGVEAAGGVAVLRTADGGTVSVRRATGPDGAPGWCVSTLAPEPGRFHPSIVGVLREIRNVVDPDRPPGRLVIAPAPALPDDA